MSELFVVSNDLPAGPTCQLPTIDETMDLLENVVQGMSHGGFTHSLLVVTIQDLLRPVRLAIKGM
jgi:hypothetical protein